MYVVLVIPVLGRVVLTNASSEPASQRDTAMLFAEGTMTADSALFSVRKWPALTVLSVDSPPFWSSHLLLRLRGDLDLGLA
ncbi:hypothetical protein STANM309S_05880 [Streptomyces tanashiensis]